MKEAYGKAAHVSMLAASNELLAQRFGDESTDGAWQRRGYASLNGLVTVVAMDTNKCVDFEILSKTCKTCEVLDKKGAETYKNYDCGIKHEGSAGSMESAGVISCFKCSVEKNRLRYTTYIGDSSSYNSVVKSNLYPGYDIGKDECVGHVQKRVGTLCRNLQKRWGSTKLKDGRTISGAGRLTTLVINKMQNYFGIAIRTYNQDVYELKKAIGAVLYHYSEAKDSETRDVNTWCKYWQSQNNGTRYEEKKGVPETIKVLLRLIFDNLAKDELLAKCLHGKTQNNNEALNSLVWKLVPKDVFDGRYIVEMGVSSAVIHFNDVITGTSRSSVHWN